MNNSSKVRLRDFSGENFDRGSSKLVEVLWYLTKITFFLNAFPFPNGFKRMLLQLFGAKTGKGIIIKPRVNIHFPWKLIIGNDVWIGEEVSLLNFELLEIGDNVCISQRAYLCGGNHDYQIPAMPYRNGPIKLNNGCWIGACSFIGPGVEIGIDTVVTAGAVVTTNLPPNSIFKGNPATFLKPRWKNTTA